MKLQIDGLDVEFKVIKKVGLRNTYIYIKSASLVIVKSNIRILDTDLQKLVDKKSSWIIKKIRTYQENHHSNFEDYLFGVRVTDRKAINSAILQEQLHWYIHTVIDDIACAMGVQYNTISLKSYKTIWGSCDVQNNLKFNTKLVHFPKSVIRYVIIHELAHVQYKNHKKEFWNFVALYEPNYKALRQRLKNLIPSQ